MVALTITVVFLVSVINWSNAFSQTFLQKSSQAIYGGNSNSFNRNRGVSSVQNVNNFGRPSVNTAVLLLAARPGDDSNNKVSQRSLPIHVPLPELSPILNIHDVPAQSSLEPAPQSSSEATAQPVTKAAPQPPAPAPAPAPPQPLPEPAAQSPPQPPPEPAAQPTPPPLPKPAAPSPPHPPQPAIEPALQPTTESATHWAISHAPHPAPALQPAQAQAL